MFIVNASNRYTIAMTDIEPRNWNYYTMYIRSVIHGVMQEMGYSEDQIGQYFKMSGDTTVTKTHGRKSIGGINRMVMDSLLDLVFMEYLVYGMQLKKYGIPDVKIQRCINDLFQKNIMIKEKSSEEC